MLLLQKKSENVIIPRVVVETAEEAKSEIEKLNLKVETIQEESDFIEKGYVLRQEPIYNTTVEEGTTVELYVSMGQ